MVDDNLKNEVESLRVEINRLKSKKDIVPHRHCMNCGIAIPPDKQFCSKKCEDEWNTLLRRKKMNMYIWMIFLVILIIILMASMGGL
ncbi:MAG: DUF2116 family Zn-ribbon domain-containing protein [Euryarchaeota archaeon]|nr:DUF2116 family Zn-ribbon domain-containing protein [Euryarchaeota archaeon]